MKKHLFVLFISFAALLIVMAAASPTTAAENVKIRLLNPPRHGLLELAVGESRTFYIQIDSKEPFNSAMALTNAYYPGRGIFWHGADIVVHDTTAVLELTMTGKSSTADLYAVCDWPEPGMCWDAGTAPVAIAAGVRFGGGNVVFKQFPFAVVVP